MKLIIAGGRDYVPQFIDQIRLDLIHDENSVMEVVSGKAKGADKFGEDWADEKGIPVKPFPAAWEDLSFPDAIIKTRADGTQYDARAGHRRNEWMAKYADAVALLPGGKGTQDMAIRAKRHNLHIFDLR